MSSFILSPLASLDLDETWEYIAGDDIDAADRWVSEFERAIDLLAEMPNLGHTFAPVKTVLDLLRPEHQ